MSDDEARKLVERLERGASPSIDVGSHLQKYQDLCDEAAAFIKATIATDEKPVAWRQEIYPADWEVGELDHVYIEDKADLEGRGSNIQPLFLHPDPKVKELREALKSFAGVVYNDNGDVAYDKSDLRNEHYHRARAALASTGDQDG